MPTAILFPAGETAVEFNADRELAELRTAVVAQIDAMLPAVMFGKGVRLANARAQGDLLFTRPMPCDCEEVPGDTPLFRVTSIDEVGTPFGHTVVGKAAYRTFRATANVREAPGRLLDLFDTLREALRPDITQGVVGITLGEPTEFLYRLRYRDHGIGTSPVEGLISADGRNLIYSRPLSGAELREFEMEPVGAHRARWA